MLSYNDEIEEAFLGMVMLDDQCLNEVDVEITDDTFYLKYHKRIWNVITDLRKASTGIDILQVSNAMASMGASIEDRAGISMMTNRVGGTYNAPKYARILKELEVKRKLDEFAHDLHERSQKKGDIFELSDWAVKRSVEISNFTPDSEVSLDDMILQEIEIIDSERLNDGVVTGIPSGFEDVDDILKGFQDGNLYILAARPGMGKTGLALNFAENVVKDKKKVLFIQLEMSTRQMIRRRLSLISRANTFRASELNDLDMKRIREQAKKLIGTEMTIWDEPAMNVHKLRSKARRHKHKHGLDMIFVDYLQLLKGESKGSREQEVSDISRTLKLIAKELNVPVFSMAQLSRGVEMRGGEKRPMLSDLRESGAIEQDADAILFLYRPEYYGITEDADGRPTDGLAKFIIAKHRNGGLGDVNLKFVHNLISFEDWRDDGSWVSNVSPNKDFEDEGSERERSGLKPEDDELPF